MTNAAQEAIVRWSSNIMLEQEPDTELSNRFADNWRPLFAIADALKRGERVRSVAKAMTSGPREYSDGVQLLIDIRRVFKQLGVDRIDRTVLLAKLQEFDTWNDWGRPSLLTRNELSAILRERRVPPAHTIQHKGSRADRRASEWGWYRNDFEEAWQGCPPEEADEDVRAIEEE
jgi:hypothetical protein